jgi:CBS domain containing-hemolysin-like protein
MLVRQIMVPRTELIAVKADSTLEEMIEYSTQHPFTKYPVYEENLDQVIGVVHLKDMVSALYGKNKSPYIAKDLMRDAIFIPETARLDVLLNRFRARKRHIAIVLDEYGGTAGVVTLEDLLEEIVGEVSDPFDDEPEIQGLPDGSSSIDGLTLIDEVNEHFNLQLTDNDYDTIAGYVLGQLGRMAQVGDVIHADGAELRITTMDGLRIERLTLTQHNVPGEDPPPVELPAE